MKRLIFQGNNPYFSDSWHQGFIISPSENTPYGLKQIKGGPCGIIAAVQCYFLKHLLHLSQPKNEQEVAHETRREICLVAALTDLLMKVKNSNKLILIIPASQNLVGTKFEPGNCLQVIVDASGFQTAF